MSDAKVKNNKVSKQLIAAFYLTIFAYIIMLLVLPIGRNLLAFGPIGICIPIISIIFIIISIILAVDSLVYEDKNKLAAKVIIISDVLFFVLLVGWLIIASFIKPYYRR